VAQHDRVAHRLAAQVERAVAQPQVSSTATSSSIGNGGVGEVASTSSSATASSISPVGSVRVDVLGVARDDLAERR
jgi:hypothetical protein